MLLLFVCPVLLSSETQICVCDFRPAIFHHILPTIGIDRIHIAFEHPVIITVYKILSYGKFSVFADQHMFHSDRLQCFLQIVDQHADPVVLHLPAAFSRIRLSSSRIIFSSSMANISILHFLTFRRELDRYFHALTIIPSGPVDLSTFCFSVFRYNLILKRSLT